MGKKKNAKYGRDAPVKAVSRATAGTAGEMITRAAAGTPARITGELTATAGRKTGEMARRTAAGKAAFLVDPDQWKVLISDGYRPISQCPEVQMCIGIYADLIASMTIHLMANAEGGDIRIRNELAKKLDVSPCGSMTRSTFISWLVRTMMTEGNAVIIPHYSGELLEDLEPVQPGRVSFLPEDGGRSYSIMIDGRRVNPETVLHFAVNPAMDQPWRGAGYTIPLRDIVRSLRQSEATRQALMESPVPSIIVKVDGLTEEFSSVKGRKKLREQYLDASENGEPWFIPSEAFSVETVKPLTLNDLAIKTNLELDKRAIAAIFGVPAFMVGIGDYNKDEFQHFIASRVAMKAHIIEQELTKKLLYSPDWYFRMNSRSLYNYSMAELIQAGSAMIDRMAMRRNEWRDWLGMPPDPEMEELLALENYIPANRLGDQKKLNGGADEDPDGE